MHDEIVRLKAVIADKDAEIETIKTEARDEAVKHIDFSIQAVTIAVTLLRENKRWDLAYILEPILDQLVICRMEATQMFHTQVADQLDRPRGAKTSVYDVAEGCSQVQRCGKEGDVASGAMVWAPTQSRDTSGHKCSERRYHKDLVNAVLDLHLEVALSTMS